MTIFELIVVILLVFSGPIIYLIIYLVGDCFTKRARRKNK